MTDNTKKQIHWQHRQKLACINPKIIFDLVPLKCLCNIDFKNASQELS